ncbi:MAG: hypothetical protein BGO41_08165 [Clostridiales bacterium 38-18]|nr:MAG: hypothetical protein BGO41_08165 [Clostridiales bacterium 38-18]
MQKKHRDRAQLISDFIKGLEYTLFLLLIVFTVAGFFRKETLMVSRFGLAWAINFLLYGFSAATIEFFKKKPAGWFMTVFITLIGISILLITNGVFYLLSGPLVVVFVLSMIRGMNYSILEEKIEPLKSRIFYTDIILGLIIFILKLGDIEGYGALKSYYLIYVIISLLLLNLVNMNNAYASGTHQINRSKNVEKFGRIALGISISLIIIVQLQIFDFWSLILALLDKAYNVIYRVVSLIIYPLLYLMDKLLGLFRLDGLKEVDIAGPLSPDMQEQLPNLPNNTGIPNWMVTVFYVITWSVIILISILLLKKAYDVFKSRKKKMDSYGSEERSFVFNRKEMLGNLLGRFKKEASKLPQNEVRKKYREQLIKNDNLYLGKKKYETPYEYMIRISADESLSDEDKLSFEKLTMAYQIARYREDLD